MAKTKIGAALAKQKKKEKPIAQNWGGSQFASMSTAC